MSTEASPAQSSAGNRSAATGCRVSAPKPAGPTTSCSSSNPVWSRRTRCDRDSRRLTPTCEWCRCDRRLQAAAATAVVVTATAEQQDNEENDEEDREHE